MAQKKQVDNTQQPQVNFDFNPEEINELSTQVTEMQFLGGTVKENVEEEGLDSEEFADFLGEDIPSAVNEEDFSFEMDGLPAQDSSAEDNSEEEFNFGEENELNENSNPTLDLGDETEDRENVEEGSQEGETIEEEFSEETTEEDGNDNQEEALEESESDNQEEADISNQEPAEETKPKMKIKEVKYGMTVITNIGNYENIRTHIEATAEVDNNEDFIGCIQELSNQIRRIGRHEYAEIKRKNMRQPNQPPQQNQPNRPQQGQQSRPQQGQQSRPQQGQQSYQNRSQQQNHQGVNPNQQGQTRQPHNQQQNQNENQTGQNQPNNIPNEQRPQ